MFGIEFSSRQKLAVWVLIGVSAIGLSVLFARNTWHRASGDVRVAEPSENSSYQVVTSGSDAKPGSKDNRTGKVVFHIVGCVKVPGVYALPCGSRIVDAVRTAGGAKPHANLDALNLAAKIEDGEKIHVPSIEETKAPTPQTLTVRSFPVSNTSSSSASGSKLTTPGEGMVHINSADSAELQRLPGVGPAIAGRIIEHRTSIGRFTRVEQLMDVRGIGPVTFDKMRPFVAL